ncbi:TPA: DotU family type IV/VI secretion system protein [Escherichia coli]|uniref:DotU family type IV/VI secretion system protein n=1 Tax=Escherichia coli TaxID=562 RepID=UPI0017C7BBDD|nr:DotU family type IV/VI secretion system protein [Escherichia coli]EFC4116893.1 DotU family type IV/VI secretion system protein [Escherichia coli]MCX3737832.1 DotU family type IV/VI secretion system protein [Escherichia coli]HCD2552782.1 DotU family type IV/VI secretion system protein [Escherichia coli]HCJ6139394.1 DotU family type IV/VI secretion system protein [Escherichia coli]HCN7542080.1 DotU family type IV/VI secretion system protein [Escherichia coli]
MNIYVMEVLVNIVECYMPVFKLISSVKVFPEEYGDYDSTRKHIIDTVEDVVRNSDKISLSDSERDAAFYSIVVMLDEVILCSELPYRKEWRDNLLQIKYFGHSTGGVEFFNMLNKIIESGSQAGWVFLLCLLLGFRGKYSVSNNDEINDYILRLKKQCGLNIRIEEKNKIVFKQKKNKSSWFDFYLSLAGIIIIYFALLFLIYVR